MFIEKKGFFAEYVAASGETDHLVIRLLYKFLPYLFKNKYTYNFYTKYDIQRVATEPGKLGKPGKKVIF